MHLNDKEKVQYQLQYSEVTAGQQECCWTKKEAGMVVYKKNYLPDL